MVVTFEEALRRALASPKVQIALKNKTIKRVIYVQNKLINIVTED